MCVCVCAAMTTGMSVICDGHVGSHRILSVFISHRNLAQNWPENICFCVFLHFTCSQHISDICHISTKQTEVGRLEV